MAVALITGDDDSSRSLRGRSRASEQAITLYARSEKPVRDERIDPDERAGAADRAPSRRAWPGAGAKRPGVRPAFQRVHAALEAHTLALAHLGIADYLVGHPDPDSTSTSEGSNRS